MLPLQESPAVKQASGPEPLLPSLLFFAGGSRGVYRGGTVIRVHLERNHRSRPEVLVFHPIRPLTWPFHRSYQTSRPRFSARTRSLLLRKRKSTATNLPPSISFVDFRWNISRPGSTSVCSWNEISFICEFSRREIETSDFSRWNFVTGRFFLWRDRYVDLNLLGREREDLILRITCDIVRIFNLCSLELIFFLFIVCWIQYDFVNSFLK